MQINIITDQPFPIGSASTNRIIYYSKSLLTQSKVKVWIISPTEYGVIRNTQIFGLYENIEYCYSSRTTIISNKFYRSGSIYKQFVKAKRDFLKVFGTIMAGISLLRLSKRNDKYLIFINDNSFIYIFYKLVALLTGSKIVLEKNERPYFSLKNNIVTRFILKFQLEFIYKIFDGFIVISQPLKSFIYQSGNIKAPVIIIPVLFDKEEFNTNYPREKEDYIAYCGVLNQEKDGLFTLLYSFSKVVNKHPALKLFIIGDTTNTRDKERMHKIIQETQLEQNIKIFGFVQRERMISLLMGASLLILLKPDNVQSKYCFPSRTAEFLSTGKPLLTSDIGEIRNYLKNNVNSYLCPPDDPDAVAESIIYAIQNPKHSAEVGYSGKKTAQQNFDYRLHTQKINSFFKSL